MRNTVSVLALFVATAAGAQDIPLREIVVSPNRTPIEAARTGTSVSVVTSEDLEKSGDLLLADYLARLPGLAVTANGGAGGLTNLRIRGAEPQYTAIYIDGIRVDDPAGVTVTYDLGSLLAADIGRVEVLRGSQSALYGGSAVGGIVNITTKRPARDGFSQTLSAMGGSDDTRQLGYTLGYKADRLETRLGVTHLKTRGYSAVDTLARDPSAEDDGAEVNRLSFAARYRATDTLSIGGSVFRQQSNTETDGFGTDDDSRQKREETGARLFAEWQMGATTHVFDVTRYAQDRETISDFGGTFDARRTGFSYQGTTELDALTLVYGADTSNEDVTTAGLPAGQDSRVSGVFAQAIWAVRPDLDLSAALRLDDNSRYGDFTSGRLAAAWAPIDGLVLRGAIARGFRAPSLYQQYGDAGSGIVPNTDLAPEKSRSYELGADYTFAGGASVGATVFSLDIENAIGYTACPYVDPDNGNFSCQPGTANIYENYPGTSKRKGVELTASAPVTDTLTLGGSYSYVDARDPSDTRLLRVPYHNLALSLDADLSAGLTGNLTVQHVAGRPEDALDADYTVVNAGLGYALTDDTRLSVSLRNILDEEYAIVPGYGTEGRGIRVGIAKAW